MIALIFKMNLYVFAQTCNNLSPSTFTFLVVSNSNTLVVEPDTLIEKNAVHCPVLSFWTNNISGATWIWDTIVKVNTGIYYSVMFKTQIGIPGVPLSGTLRIACDDICSATINVKIQGAKERHYIQVQKRIAVYYLS